MTLVYEVIRQNSPIDFCLSKANIALVLIFRSGKLSLRYTA